MFALGINYEAVLCSGSSGDALLLAGGNPLKFKV